MAARALSTTIQSLKFDRIAGLPYAAMPIATALSLQTNVPLIYPRKEVKQYGTSAAIEGPFKPEETALVVDDLISNGASKFEAIEKLEAGGLKVSDIAVLIDRQPKGSHSLEKKSLRLHAVFTLPELLDLWQASGAIDEPTKQSVLSFLGFG
jgi:uridine monophosphate synthetase